MKAVVYSAYGAPEVLQQQDIKQPDPGEHDILIKVEAAEVTKADCELRSFNFQVKWFLLPLRVFMGIRKPRKQILGGYFAGVVQAVGDKITQYKPGDEVFGASGLRLGAHAEYLCMPENASISPKPDNLSFAEAAAVPLGGLNALHFIKRANVQNGERVLIIGAGGSIGIFGIQLAKALGAEVTVVDSGHKRDFLYQLGIDYFIDYTKEDFTQNGQAYDVIFSMVAKSSYRKCLQSLEPKGRYLLANPRLSDMLKALVTTIFTDKTVVVAFAGETREALLTLKGMIEQGRLKPFVDKIFTFSEAAKAHHQVESEHRLGAVILSPNRGADSHQKGLS